MANKTKLEKVQEAIDSAPAIDINVNIRIPKIQTLKEDKKYKCMCCGDSFNVQKNNFSASKSILYQSNNGYLTICNKCRDSYYYQLVDLYSGNDEKAIRYMCQQFGWFFHEDALEASRQVSHDRSRISSYITKKNLGQSSKHGSIDIDSVKYEFISKPENVIETLDDAIESDTVNIKSVKFFGTGFPNEDYLFLQNEYDDWTKRHECNTKSQEEVFKRICFKQLEILKATRASKDTKELDKTLQDLLSTGNLQPKQNSRDTLSEAQTLGTLLDKWENTRPLPEIDEELRDVDKIGKYIDVFFKGHLSKMLGLKNGLSNMYTQFMKKYTVEKPEYEDDENSEALFDAIFGNDNDE